MQLVRASRRRGAVGVVVAVGAVAALMVSPGPAAAGEEGAAKVDAGLARAVQGDGQASFFVVLKDRADLSKARKGRTHAARAKAAVGALRAEAEESQRGLTAFLDREKVGHRDYWIANAVQVTGDKGLVQKLAARDDVASVVPSRTYALDDLTVGDGGRIARTRTDAAGTDAADTPEWGVADIKADQVWSQYGTRGEGIVIADLDSGAQFDHPDLVKQYRGNNGDGTFTHDYNFYDPTGQCAPGGVPCDNNGHGTHTLGTMVGAKGVGVAPGATWIAAKGCETSACSDGNLLAAGQWILAPTDRNGQNPRPDLAPNIVNNSWGGGNTTFYQDIVQAWNAAGIFEAFAAGNDGNGTRCSTAHAPGAQAPAYGVGAYDAAGRIASFSGFGPSLVDGSTKPDISAPGVDIRSTWPGSAYKAESGTSMATPHVSGAVALLWSASPSLIGQIDATRALLDQGARDVDDTHCGGTPGMNNVWGEGKLDILASVAAAPRDAAAVSGTVTDKATGAKLPGVTVTATGGAGTRSVRTGADGTYRLWLPAGRYDFAFSGYGYADGSAKAVTLTDEQELTQDVALSPVAAHRVTGSVLDVAGKPLAGATVELTGAPVPAATTDATGRYTLPQVAEGAYPMTVTPAAPTLCNGVFEGELTVAGGDAAKDVRTPARTDRSGNSCAPAPYAWIDGTKKVALSGDEDAARITLPFPVRHYGVSYSSASVTTNGLVNFLSSRVGDYRNTALPTSGPNGVRGVVAPLWDDLTLGKGASVQTATTGATGGRKFAIVWNDAAYADGTAGRASFQVVFDEATGAATFQYRKVADRGAGATVGIADQAGTDALQYSYDQPVLTDGTAIRFTQGATS
ncbi:S8 family serine peptidase [Streptomyces sp. NPDC060194]|uniref:S8 family serine peptidase n=1 Tax=Streptomyces sp. NPDC060194 TaxID=3347069 RepID=UPI00365B62DC